MIEGWHGEDYLVLFTESEIDPAGDRYEVVQDSTGNTFSVPAVPFDQKYLEPFSVPAGGIDRKPDPRFLGRIKWYQTPLLFGGDPNLKENCGWVNHEQHPQLVRFWNDKYRTRKRNG